MKKQKVKCPRSRADFFVRSLSKDFEPIYLAKRSCFREEEESKNVKMHLFRIFSFCFLLICFCNFNFRQKCWRHYNFLLGSGCGSVGRAVYVSNQVIAKLLSRTCIFVNCELDWKDDNKEKEAGNIFKKIFSRHFWAKKRDYPTRCHNHDSAFVG